MEEVFDVRKKWESDEETRERSGYRARQPEVNLQLLELMVSNTRLLFAGKRVQSEAASHVRCVLIGH